MRAVLFLVILFCFTSARAQVDTTREISITDTSSAINRPRLYRTIGITAAVYAAELSYLQWVWYADHERVPFEFYDDSRGYLQLDKCGHAWGAYVQSHVGFHALKACGVSKKSALIYGGALGLVLQTPIEVWDGLYEGWGFSWSDMAANAAGSALFVAQQWAWDEQVVKYKWSFAPSPYAKQAAGYLGDTFFGQVFNDYNGHTYWLSAPLQKLGWAAAPPWLCISAGYSGNGMFGEFENRAAYRGLLIPPTARTRQFLFSLDVDWTRIRTRNRFLKTLFNAGFAVKLPFPAVELNSEGKWRMYGLYY